MNVEPFNITIFWSKSNNKYMCGLTSNEWEYHHYVNNSFVFSAIEFVINL